MLICIEKMVVLHLILQIHCYTWFQDEKNLRNNRKYIIIDTNKAGVRFRNGILRELNDQYIVSKENYLEQQKSVVDEIIDIACKIILYCVTDTL